MIPVAQLDPASLSLWVNLEQVSRHPASEQLVAGVSYAVNGDIEGWSTLFDSIDHPGVRTRCVHLASAIWHEQRHFLDVTLTNYGAFRVRQFLSLYWNQAHALSSMTGRSVHCPIHVYLDTPRANLLGLDPPTEALLSLARDTRQRMQMVSEENRVVTTRWGPLQLGGDAQLEALGYLFQLAAIQKAVGWEEAFAVQRDMPVGFRRNLRYEWALRVCAEFGLMPKAELDSANGIEDRVVVENVTLLIPILVGSLATRRWGQEQVTNDQGGSGYAANRLYGLLRALQSSDVNYGNLTSDQAWDAVNGAAKSLWGRSVIEEVETDLAIESQNFEMVLGELDDGAVAKALTSLHDLRRRFVELMIRFPRVVIDPEAYVETLFPLLAPMPVQAMPSGVVGDAPDGWERVIGYRDPDSRSDSARWTWAMIPAEWPPTDSSIALDNRRAWAEIISDYAPLAKLMMNGYRHDTMLGPEILALHERFASAVKLDVDPMFDRPVERRNAAAHLAFLIGSDTGWCDTCKDKVPILESLLVSPWMVRHSASFAMAVIDSWGGDKEAQLRFIRDWSTWLLCPDCRRRFVPGSASSGRSA